MMSSEREQATEKSYYYIVGSIVRGVAVPPPVRARAMSMQSTGRPSNVVARRTASRATAAWGTEPKHDHQD